MYIPLFQYLNNKKPINVVHAFFCKPLVINSGCTRFQKA